MTIRRFLSILACRILPAAAAGCILAEILDPGDYYLSDHTAYFFRWQITVAF